MAKICNVAQNTYSQYETGARQIDNDILIILSKYFNVPIDYILGNTSNLIEEETDDYEANEIKKYIIAKLDDDVEIHFKNAKKKLTPEQIKIFKAFYKSITDDADEEDEQ